RRTLSDGHWAICGRSIRTRQSPTVDCATLWISRCARAAAREFRETPSKVTALDVRRGPSVLTIDKERSNADKEEDEEEADDQAHKGRKPQRHRRRRRRYRAVPGEAHGELPT